MTLNKKKNETSHLLNTSFETLNLMFLMCIKPIDQYTRTFTLGRLLLDGENDFRLKDNHNK